MISIFFDLETSDLHFVGQIINYAFITVDDDWNEISRLTGNVKISRNQLPVPRAILANRVNIIEHNDGNVDEEHIAMLKIRQYLEKIYTESPEPVALIGYNSCRFDLGYLRTSMIRNGLSPYIGYDIKYKDVLYPTQFLATQKDCNFLDRIKDSDGNYELRLESVSQNMGILDGAQLHESTFDVELTIKLARYYIEEYDLDVRFFESYQGRGNEKNSIVRKVYPDKDVKYHKEHGEAGNAYVACLLSNKRYAIWVDLEKYEKGLGRDSLSWCHKDNSSFFIESKIEDREDLQLVYEKAKKEFSDLTFDNFFPKKNCDIEQFIYDISFEEIEALNVAIWYKKIDMLRLLDSSNALRVYKRYLLRTRGLPEQTDKALFLKYALYRYGGRFKISKWNPDSVYEEGVYNADFHDTWNELILDINTLIEESDNDEDIGLLNALKQFYYESDVYKIAGKELELINRSKNV